MVLLPYYAVFLPLPLAPGSSSRHPSTPPPLPRRASLLRVAPAFASASSPPFAGMAKFADVAYKSVTAGLGLATLWVGGNLIFNITRGISWHYAQDKPPGEPQQKN